MKTNRLVKPPSEAVNSTPYAPMRDVGIRSANDEKVWREKAGTRNE